MTPLIAPINERETTRRPAGNTVCLPWPTRAGRDEPDDTWLVAPPAHVPQRAPGARPEIRLVTCPTSVIRAEASRSPLYRPCPPRLSPDHHKERVRVLHLRR